MGHIWHSITHAFTSSGPIGGFFTHTIPHAFSPSGPVGGFFVHTIPQTFTHTIPHVFSPSGPVGGFFVHTLPKAFGPGGVIGGPFARLMGIKCAVTSHWQPPETLEGVTGNGLQCANDPMNGPARDWSYQCGCQGGADLVCPPGTSEYERGNFGHEWCNSHGINTCDNICLRKGLSCYRHSGDFLSGDACTDKATRIACCDPTGNGADPKLCPPGYCQGSAACQSELYALCNTDAGFAAFPDICKTFAFKNRTNPSINISTVAQKWCAIPGNSEQATAGYSAPPKGFCECYNAFGKGPNFAAGAGLDMITGHPKCFNGGCASYGYDDPATINEQCPSDICIQIVEVVAGGNITMNNDHFDQKCPGKSIQLIHAQAHAAAAELKAAELEHCQLMGNCTCEQLGNCPPAPVVAPGAPSDAPDAPDAPVAPIVPDAPKKSKIHPIVVIIVIIAVIGAAMGIWSIMGAKAATSAAAAGVSASVSAAVSASGAPTRRGK